MSSDEQVAEFVAFTGSGPDEAKQYLEMAGGSLEQAVSLFMEMGGGGGGARATPAAASAPAGAGGGGGGEEDAVRAPIAAFDDQIINAEAEQRRMQHAIRADAEAMERRMSFDRTEAAAGGDWTCSKCGNVNFKGRTHCFNCGTAKDAATAERGATAINELFKPPDYNEVGPFFQTLEKAKAEGKWVLVNIQQSEAFTSHALNRDVWREEMVQDLVCGNFVFWQRDNMSTEGAQFVKTYKIEESLPHICMVDPRTGRSVKSFKADRFVSYAMEKLIEFMDAFPAPAGGAPAPTPAAASASSTAPAVAPPAAVPAAAAASAGSAGSAPSGSVSAAVAGGAVGSTAPAQAAPDATAAAEPSLGPGQRLDGGGGSGAAADATAAPGAAGEESLGKVAEMPEEPGTDSEHVKVSFRLPSGQRVMRRFRHTDALEVVFAVASALTSSPVHGVDVSTQMPKKSLRDLEGGLALSVKDAKIGGNMLVVETGKRRRVA